MGLPHPKVEAMVLSRLLGLESSSMARFGDGKN